MVVTVVCMTVCVSSHVKCMQWTSRLFTQTKVGKVPHGITRPKSE